MGPGDPAYAVSARSRVDYTVSDPKLRATLIRLSRIPPVRGVAGSRRAKPLTIPVGEVAGDTVLPMGTDYASPTGSASRAAQGGESPKADSKPMKKLVSILYLYRFSDPLDKLLMPIGILRAMLEGAVLPCLSIIFGAV